MTQKIGLLGCSSHAERFSEILNLECLPDFWPNSDAQVLSIWTPDSDQTRQSADSGKIPIIASSPDYVVAEMMGMMHDRDLTLKG